MIDEEQIKAVNRVLAAARAWHAWTYEDDEDSLSILEGELDEAVEAYETAFGDET